MALGPVQAFTGSNTKLRWTDLYASDSLNKAFLGMPKGVYLGFTPVVTGLVLDLNRDTAIIYSGLIGTFAVGTTITGGASGATAVIRFIHSGLPSDGFLNIDTIVGTFIEGETFNGPGVSATLEQVTFDDISVAKVASTSSFAGNRTEEAITVIIGSDISLDFSPGTITDGTYFVILTASYEVGQESSAQISSRKDAPADGRLEIGICAVTKFGGVLALEPITTTNRADPYADNTTRVGLMPAGAVDDLADALQTVREVAASRTGYDGISLGAFDPGQPKTTGLPGRIGSDLERTNMGARLGKDSLVVQGNDYTLQTIPSGNTLNISGSFAAKTRDVQPFRDVTNNDIPLGLTVPILLRPDGIDGQTLTITDAVGAFAVGNKIEGTGGGSAIIRGVSGDLLDVDDQGKSFFVGDTLTSSGSTATLVSVDIREGAITAPESSLGGDPVRNLVVLLDTFSGKMPTNADGVSIYGRLLFGPSGSSGPGGGDPGELLVATGLGEQINYTNGSTAITGNNLDFTEYFLPGDIIEGADGRFYEIDAATGSVQVGTLLLTAGKPYVGSNAAAGFEVGPGPRRRLRYLLKFVSQTGGVETDEVIDLDSIPAGALLRVFFPAWINRGRSNYSAVLSLRATGDSHALPSAGSAIPGLSYNATGPTSQTIGAIKTIQLGGLGVGTGNFHTINFVTGTVDEVSPGVVTINATGPIGPIGGSGPSPAGPAGPQGKGFNNIFSTLAHQTFPMTVGGTGTFDFSPRRVRFYTLSHSRNANLGFTGDMPVVDVLPTPAFDTDSTVTFVYAVTGTPSAAQSLFVYCAAATD